VGNSGDVVPRLVGVSLRNGLVHYLLCPYSSHAHRQEENELNPRRHQGRVTHGIDSVVVIKVKNYSATSDMCAV
jgi:hypothetical protein